MLAARTAGQPTGRPTRGTTAAHRLARFDRWLVAVLGPALRSAPDPLVVDLGFGASPVTTVELFRRLRARVRADVEVVGFEIDPGRVQQAAAVAETGLSFALGGFELPTGARRPAFVRAFNVLRQYDVDQVSDAWTLLGRGVCSGGIVVDGTCDEAGRLATWITLRERSGRLVPESLTLASRVSSLDRPSDLAARLPKALIHNNVPGERVHEVLALLDRGWAMAAPAQVFGARQRWVEAVARSGLPVLSGDSSHRRGEVTLAWEAVRPLSGPDC